MATQPTRKRTRRKKKEPADISKEPVRWLKENVPMSWSKAYDYFDSFVARNGFNPGGQGYGPSKIWSGPLVPFLEQEITEFKEKGWIAWEELEEVRATAKEVARQERRLAALRKSLRGTVGCARDAGATVEQLVEASRLSEAQVDKAVEKYRVDHADKEAAVKAHYERWKEEHERKLRAKALEEKRQAQKKSRRSR